MPAYTHVGYVFARGIPPGRPSYVATQEKTVYCAGPSVPVASLVAPVDSDDTTDPYTGTTAVYWAFTMRPDHG